MYTKYQLNQTPEVVQKQVKEKLAKIMSHFIGIEYNIYKL